jgi:hypothetical protein
MRFGAGRARLGTVRTDIDRVDAPWPWGASDGLPRPPLASMVDVLSGAPVACGDQPAAAGILIDGVSSGGADGSGLQPGPWWGMVGRTKELGTGVAALRVMRGGEAESGATGVIIPVGERPDLSGFPRATGGRGSFSCTRFSKTGRPPPVGRAAGAPECGERPRAVLLLVPNPLGFGPPSPALCRSKKLFMCAAAREPDKKGASVAPILLDRTMWGTH